MTDATDLILNPYPHLILFGFLLIQSLREGSRESFPTLSEFGGNFERRSDRQ